MEVIIGYGLKKASFVSLTTLVPKILIQWFVDVQNVGTVIIMIGTNDCLQSVNIGKFKNDLNWLLRDHRRYGCRRIAMCTIPPLRNRSVRPYNEVIKSIAQKRGIVLIDANESFRSRERQLISVDGIHPNYNGLCAIITSIGTALLE